MQAEFLHGRPLSPDELEMLHRQIEEGYDNTATVDDEIRGIVARKLALLARKASAAGRINVTRKPQPQPPPSWDSEAGHRAILPHAATQSQPHSASLPNART